MNNTYSPRYLRPEPVNAYALEDAQVEAIFQRKKENAMADELSAMMQRNPNRRASADKMEAVPAEAPAARQDKTMLIVSGIMLMITLAVSLAQVLA